MIASGWKAGLWALAGCLLLAGCGAGLLRVAEGDAALPADDGSAAFLDRVSTGTTVTENDALRGILLLLDGKDASGDFRQRVNALVERNILSRTWDHRASRPITRGKLAYLVCQACKFPGGVILTLTGPSQRYCLRELQYRELMGSGAFYSQVTGMEFVAVLTRADAYLETGKLPDVLTVEAGP